MDFTEYLTQCDVCPYAGRQVGTKGNIKAKFVIIGESPRLEDLKADEPFVGPQGDMIHKIIPMSDDIYVTNALRCRPKKKTPSNNRKAIACCNVRLMAEIQAYPRQAILALGAVAVQALTGEEVKITKVRGKVFESPLAENGIMTSVHPAFLLRGAGNYDTFKTDLERAAILGGVNQKPADTSIRMGRIEVNKKVVTTVEEVTRAVERIAAVETVAADVETSGFSCIEDRILCLGVATSPSDAIIFAPETLQMDPVKKLFNIRNEHLKWTWHNGKFDIGFLREIGLNARVDDDTMLLSYCLNSQIGIHDLDQVGADWLQIPGHKHMLDEYLPNKQTSYEVIPTDVLYKYLGFDVADTYRLREPMWAKVNTDAGHTKLYTKTLIPASELVYHIERRGMLVDEDIRSANEVLLDEEIQGLAAVINTEVFKASGGDLKGINPNSPIQVCHIIYNVLGIKPKGKKSSAKEVLVKLPQVPFIVAIQNYRKAAKMQSTYVRGLIKHIQYDGRFHSTFLIHGTPTGRFASRRPNAQNIPRRSDIRNQITAPEGYVLQEDDLSQAELRSLAMLSHDVFLRSIYLNTNRSLHKEVAKDMYCENYTKDQLIRAKAVNFGIVYGRTGFSLAQEFDLPASEGQRMIDSWWERSPKAKEFVDKCRQVPLKSQTIVTPFGRKRYYGIISKANRNDVQNEASNFPHQSIASDINLHATMKAFPKLQELDVHVVDLVHDSSLKEVPKEKGLNREVADIMSQATNEVVEEWFDTDIPFIMDAKCGSNWGSLKELTD